LRCGFPEPDIGDGTQHFEWLSPSH